MLRLRHVLQVMHYMTDGLKHPAKKALSLNRRIGGKCAVKIISGIA